MEDNKLFRFSRRGGVRAAVLGVPVKKPSGGCKVKKELKLILSAMTSLIIVAALCAMPATHPNTTTTHAQTAAAAQSVSGKIAEVQKTSFTLSVGPSHTVSNMSQ